MKKKFLALCMVLCLSLSLVPAAVAAEEDAPNVREQVTEEEVLAYLAQQPAANTLNSGLTKGEDGKYHIYDETDFDQVTNAQWLGENTFVIEDDLDLSQSTKNVSEWGGYIQYFRGTLEGANENITISGMDNNTYLIYGLNGGTIKNLTLSFNGEAAGLAAVSAAYSTPIGVRIENVDTIGNVYLTADNQSNYSPYAYCAPQGGMEMINCTNNANITGNIYGGIFYGYYPLNRGAKDDIVFDGCVNNGNVTMRNASMFFGNPSVDNVMASAEDGFTITIQNCKNEGEIRGTVSAHYFVSSLTTELATDGFSAKMESALLGKTSENITPHVVSNNALSENNLLVGAELDGFTVSVDEDKDICITAPTSAESIEYYIVSVSSYVTLYNDETHQTGGTDRYTVSETVYPDDLTVNLKYYGVADSDFGSAGSAIETMENSFATRVNDGNVYYTIEKWPDDALYDNLYQRYASAQSGQEVTPSCKEPAFLTVTAFNADNEIVGITNYKESGE